MIFKLASFVRFSHRSNTVLLPAWCYKRDGFNVEDELKSGFKSLCCNSEVLMQMLDTDYYHDSFVFELIMLRAEILYTPNCECS